MKLEEFNYNLPEELIAQTPIKERDHSRLMVVNKDNGEIEHKVFSDIISYFSKGDTLVLNDTKVIPARLIGVKEDTNAIIEVLLLENICDNIWTSLVKPAKRVKCGTIISFGNSELRAKCIEVLDEGIRKFELIYDGILNEILDRLGLMPLPPYIHEKLNDKSRYQTVYARNCGSSAAPTAGLHFTLDLLNKIKEKGVNIVYITLHVGIGTFRPVMEDDITNHKMHSEYYSMSDDTASILNKTRESGHNIVAVGTTSVRTLETIMNKNKTFVASSGKTDIFIYPGYRFLGVDEIITNFHLPKSTLLMLVSAFATKDLIFKAYQEAVINKYRFFSFGDAMYIKTNRNV